jgi:hypothetical protein
MDRDELVMEICRHLNDRAVVFRNVFYEIVHLADDMLPFRWRSGGTGYPYILRTVTPGTLKDAPGDDFMDLLDSYMVDWPMFLCQPDDEIISLGIVGCLKMFPECFAPDGDPFIEDQFCLGECESVSLDRIGVVGMEHPHLLMQSFYQICIERAQGIQAFVLCPYPIHEVIIGSFHIGIG